MCESDAKNLLSGPRRLKLHASRRASCIGYSVHVPVQPCAFVIFGSMLDHFSGIVGFSEENGKLQRSSELKTTNLQLQIYPDIQTRSDQEHACEYINDQIKHMTNSA